MRNYSDMLFFNNFQFGFSNLLKLTSMTTKYSCFSRLGASTSLATWSQTDAYATDQVGVEGLGKRTSNFKILVLVFTIILKQFLVHGCQGHELKLKNLTTESCLIVLPTCLPGFEC